MSSEAHGIPAGPIETEPIDYPTPGVFPTPNEREGILRDIFRTTGVELGAYDDRIACWFAEFSDWSTFAVMASWVSRAAAAREKSSRAPADAAPGHEQQIRAIADRAVDDPFFVSDCEGELQVWREKALTHVRRDESGQIVSYSFPSSYRATDEVIRIDLDTWDLGEDATDDQRRQDINDLVDSRAAVSVLVDEVQRLRAALAATQANALLFAADRLEAVCPDGTAELRLALCQCDAAEDLRTLAADSTEDGGPGCSG